MPPPNHVCREEATDARASDRAYMQDGLVSRLHQLVDLDTVIVCMGSSLHCDDAAGVAVGRELGGALPWPVFEVGVAPENFVVRIAGYQPSLVIVIDAVDFGGSPGQVSPINPDDLVDLSPSTHGPAPTSFLEALRLMHPCPCVVLGIQPLTTETGEELSPPVVDAVRRVAETFRLLADTADGDIPESSPGPLSVQSDKSETNKKQEDRS